MGGTPGFLERATTSQRFGAILRNMSEVSALYVTHSLSPEPDRIRAGNAEHEELLRAVIARKPQAVADAIVSHLDGTLHSRLQVHQIGGHRRRTSASISH